MTIIEQINQENIKAEVPSFSSHSAPGASLYLFQRVPNWHRKIKSYVS